MVTYPSHDIRCVTFTHLPLTLTLLAHWLACSPHSQVDAAKKRACASMPNKSLLRYALFPRPCGHAHIPCPRRSRDPWPSVGLGSGSLSCCLGLAPGGADAPRARVRGPGQISSLHGTEDANQPRICMHIHRYIHTKTCVRFLRLLIVPVMSMLLFLIIFDITIFSTGRTHAAKPFLVRMTMHDLCCRLRCGNKVYTPKQVRFGVLTELQVPSRLAFGLLGRTGHRTWAPFMSAAAASELGLFFVRKKVTTVTVWVGRGDGTLAPLNLLCDRHHFHFIKLVCASGTQISARVLIRCVLSRRQALQVISLAERSLIFSGHAR